MKGKKMRRGVISLLLVVVLMMSSMTVFAAGETMSEADFKADMADGKVSLTGDVTLSGTVTISENITIDGNGYTISSPADVWKTFIINNGATVALNDLTIVNAYEGGSEGGRCLDVRDGNITLTLDGATLKTTGAGNHQTINIGGKASSNNNITIKNSKIESGKSGYGITFFNPVKMTIQDSEITGWSTLYFKAASGSLGSAGSVVDVIGSTLTGINIHNGESNGFGTIVFEDKAVTVNIIDSKVVSKNTGDAGQIMFGMDEGTKDNSVTVSGESELVVEGEKATIGNEDDTANDIVIKMAASNVEIPEAFIPDTTTKIEVDGAYYYVEMINLTFIGVVDGKVIEAEDNVAQYIKDMPLTQEEIDAWTKEDTADDTMTKTGYTFKGFFYDAKGTEKVAAEDTFAADTTIYMIWDKVEVTPTPDTTPTSPKTGDTTPIALYFVVVAAVAVVFGGTRMRKAAR